MTLRRLHVPLLRVGTVQLEATQAHHARHVLRLPDGSAVEIFDDAGNTGVGTLGYPDDRGAVVAVAAVESAPRPGVKLSIASAVPKAERADWLVEKLSELGVFRWIPLATQRSVALPTGAGKRQRWMRIATESAKQSRRSGVMVVDELTPVAEAIAAKGKPGWVLSTDGEAGPMGAMLASAPLAELTIFVGPEGGWTDGELRQFHDGGIDAVRLGRTVLRVETAAIAAAAVVAAIWTGQSEDLMSGSSGESGGVDAAGGGHEHRG